MTIHPSTYDVVLEFAQAQSGYVVVNSGLAPLGSGNIQVPITAQTVTILGTLHGMRTKHLLVVAYDGQTPAQELTPGQVTIHPTTYDVVVSFAQAQSGAILVSGYAGSPEVPNVSAAFATAASWSVPGTLHSLGTNQLIVQAWSAATPRALLTPGALTVHPTTHDVVATFAQPQSGTLVLNGSVRLLLRTVESAPETDTLQPVVWSPQHRLIAPGSTTTLAPPILWAPQHRLIVPAVSVDAPASVAWLPSRFVTTSLETSLSQMIPGALATRLVSPAPETALSQVVLWSPMARLVGHSSQLDTPHLVAWAPQTRLVHSGSTIESLLTLTMPAIRLLLHAQESPTARDVTVPAGLRLIDTSMTLAIAQVLAWAPQHRLVALSLTIESSLLLALPTMRLVYEAIETATVLPLAPPLVIRLVRAGSETVIAAALASEVPHGLVSALSLEASQLVSWSPLARLVAQALTMDGSSTILPDVIRLIELVATLESTLGFEVLTPRFVQTAPTANLSQAIQWQPQARLVALIAETNTGLPVLWPASFRLVAMAESVDQARDVINAPNILVDIAALLETAQVAQWAPKIRVTLPAFETTQSQATVWSPRTRLIVSSSTTHQSFGVLYAPRMRFVASSLEAQLSQLIRWAPRVRLVASSSTTHTSQTVLWFPRMRFVASSSETSQSAGVLYAPRMRFVGSSLETQLSQSVVWTPRARFVAAASSTAAAQGLGPSGLTRLVSAGAESPVAQGIFWRPVARLVALSQESFLAVPVPLSAVTRLLLASSESAQGQAVRWQPRERLVSSATTLALSQPLRWQLQRLVETSLTTAQAPPVLWSPLARLIEASTEAGSSQDVVRDALTRLIRSGPEGNYSMGFGQEKLGLLFAAETQATAEGLVVVRFVPIGTPGEMHETLPVLWRPQERFVGTGLETDVPLVMVVSAGILFSGIFGEWSLAPLLSGIWESAPVIGGTWDIDNEE